MALTGICVEVSRTSYEDLSDRDDLTGQTPPEEKPGLIGYGMIILGMTAFSALVHFLGALCGPGDGIESSGGGDSGDGGGDGGD